MTTFGRPMPIIETERLCLRPFRFDDAQAVTTLIDDPAVVATLESVPHPYRREYAEVWIASHEKFHREHGELHLAIVLRASDELIGAGALLPGESAGVPQVGYWLGQRHWGLGYATEAVAALVDFARQDAGVRGVTARCMVGNAASGAVLGKVGFRRVGRSPIPIRKGEQTFEVDEYFVAVSEPMPDGP